MKTFVYLGVTIEESLSFKEQINSNIRKANHKIYLMRKIRGSVDNKTALLLFKAMVLPYVEFANCLLVGCVEYDKIRLQRAINKGLKLALNRDRLYDTKLLHKEANLANWETRERLSLNRLMFKY